jgi:hypothetical protein
MADLRLLSRDFLTEFFHIHAEKMHAFGKQNPEITVTGTKTCSLLAIS